LGAKEVVQADLMRSIKATEDNYLLSQRKEEEARISDALDRGRILNVALAEAPTAPVLPSSYRLQTIGFGFLLSIVVSAALALVAERMDSTFRTADEVAVILNVPVLAALQSGGSAGNNGLRIAVIPCEPQEVTDEPHS
jgi:capsular polysaccharide biosynthesis protein